MKYKYKAFFDIRGLSHSEIDNIINHLKIEYGYSSRRDFCRDDSRNFLVVEAGNFYFSEYQPDSSFEDCSGDITLFYLISSGRNDLDYGQLFYNPGKDKYFVNVLMEDVEQKYYKEFKGSHKCNKNEILDFCLKLQYGLVELHDNSDV